jgi:serpin B
MKKEIDSIKGLLAIVIFAVSLTAVLVFLITNFEVEPLIIKEIPKKILIEPSEENMGAVVLSNNEFAFDLYHSLNKGEGENIFYSPYSIFSALAITYEGSKEKTAEEIASVLHLPEGNILRSGFGALYNQINNEEKNYELNVANALWAQKDYPFLKEYIDTIEQSYGGEVTNLDFVRETENSRKTINEYIEKKTNDKIKNLIPQGALSSLTRMVITNAIYFKGKWKIEFDKEDTREADFYVTPKNIVKTEMMFMKPKEEKFNYLETEEIQVIELPYQTEEVSMFVLLPKKNIEVIEKGLNSKKLKEYKDGMKKTEMDGIYLPKFEFDTKYFMKQTLISMGIDSAFFYGKADFSKMDGTKELIIHDVIHQAYVGVDEEGTEAAGATAVIIGIESIALDETIFMANRPFIFIIQENKTENILFIGRVSNPTKSTN